MKRMAVAAGLVVALALAGTVTWRVTRANEAPLPEARLSGFPCAYPSQDLKAFAVGASEQSVRAYFGGAGFKPSSEPADPERGSCLVFACMPNAGSDSSEVQQVVFLFRDSQVAGKWLVSSLAALPGECSRQSPEIVFAGTQPRVVFPTGTASKR
jgi:hypothetical protein